MSKRSIYCGMLVCILSFFIFTKVSAAELTTLNASTYLGGFLFEQISGVASDASGQVYVVGRTVSGMIDFPVTNGAYDQTVNDPMNGDIFIAKFSPDLSTLIASTYLGGSGFEQALAVFIDSAGTVYVGGDTSSSNFPTLNGVDITSNGNGDIFVAKLTADLSNLLAASYVGGSAYDSLTAMSMDNNGDVVIAGYTGSINFPTTALGYDTTYNGGGNDGFVTKFSSNLSTILASTYLGGVDGEEINSILINVSGDVYVAGITGSTNFPTTALGYDTTYNGGGNDGFVTKFSSNLSTILASTYLGGNGVLGDTIKSSVIDSNGNIYVAGTSDSKNFPVISGTSGSGAFITKFSGDLSSPILASTFLGSSPFDMINKILLNETLNSIYAIGIVYDSLEFPSIFPVSVGAYDMSYNGGAYDGFLATVSTNLDSILVATYLGGSDIDFIENAVFGSQGGLYVGGYTYSENFPVTNSAYDTSYGGGVDAFITLFSSSMSKPQPISYPLPVTSKNMEYTKGETMEFTFSGLLEDPIQFHFINTSNNQVFIVEPLLPIESTLETSTYLFSSLSLPPATYILKFIGNTGQIISESSPFTVNAFAYPKLTYLVTPDINPISQGASAVITISPGMLILNRLVNGTYQVRWMNSNGIDVTPSLLFGPTKSSSSSISYTYTTDSLPTGSYVVQLYNSVSNNIIGRTNITVRLDKK
ncbi:MAG: SBBP repeat-containing protein [Candidatus Magasanikbacteria bacterium]|nr:SBBP repeat-containing protein [Candidatus Magasanikbacteria bacterium]